MSDGPGRVLYRENWTKADWAEDARRQAINAKVAQARKQALLNRGWVLHDRYCSHDSEWARDPLGAEEVSHVEAYRRQEEREPGSIPPWPKFEDSDWKPPPTTQKLLNIGKVKVQPMKAPVGLIFYQDYVYGKKDDV